MTHPAHLALEVDGDGAHPAAARVGPAPVFDVGALRRTVVEAEAAGTALVTFADSPGAPGAPARIEAGVRAAFLAPLTGAIGLAPQLHAPTTEPFHLATQLASLDHASLGRAGWVVGAADDPASLATVGEPRPADPRREVADVIEVARRLWDSWEDDATIRDVATGRFLDPSKVHHVRFEGAGFGVVGPLITPRPPQGQVVVLGADTLGVTAALDVALIAAPDVDGITGRAAAAREAGAPLVFAEVEVLLDTTVPAAHRRAELDAIAPWGPPERLRLVGSTADLAALLTRLTEVVDGVRLHPAVLTEDLPVLLTALRDGTVPAAAPVAGRTLRETLGLPRPANRYAVSATERTSREP